MAEDRRKRRDQLLNAARDRLSAEEEASAAPERGRASQVREVRYRGQVVRQGTTGVPGGGSTARRARSGSGGGGKDDVQVALEKVKRLYKEGLISRAEAEKKRADILDRL